MATPSSLPGPMPGVPTRGNAALTDAQRVCWWLARVLVLVGVLVVGLALLLPWSWSIPLGGPDFRTPSGPAAYFGPLNFADDGALGLVLLIVLMAPAAAMLWYLVVLFDLPTRTGDAQIVVGMVLCCLAAVIGILLTPICGAFLSFSDAPSHTGLAAGVYVSWVGYGCGLIGALFSLPLLPRGPQPRALPLAGASPDTPPATLPPAGASGQDSRDGSA